MYQINKNKDREGEQEKRIESLFLWSINWICEGLLKKDYDFWYIDIY